MDTKLNRWDRPASANVPYVLPYDDFETPGMSPYRSGVHTDKHTHTYGLVLRYKWQDNGNALMQPHPSHACLACAGYFPRPAYSHPPPVYYPPRSEYMPMPQPEYMPMQQSEYMPIQHQEYMPIRQHYAPRIQYYPRPALRPYWPPRPVHVGWQEQTVGYQPYDVRVSYSPPRSAPYHHFPGNAVRAASYQGERAPLQPNFGASNQRRTG
jgi:hypothetical protein